MDILLNIEIVEKHFKQNTEVLLWGTKTGGSDEQSVHTSQFQPKQNVQITPCMFDFKLPCCKWNKNKYRIGCQQGKQLSGML